MPYQIDEKAVQKRMEESTHLLAKAACLIEQAEDGLEWVWNVHSDWENYFVKERIDQAVKAIGYALGILITWNDNPE